MYDLNQISIFFDFPSFFFNSEFVLLFYFSSFCRVFLFLESFMFVLFNFTWICHLVAQAHFAFVWGRLWVSLSDVFKKRKTKQFFSKICCTCGGIDYLKKLKTPNLKKLRYWDNYKHYTSFENFDCYSFGDLFFFFFFFFLLKIFFCLFFFFISNVCF